MTKAFALAFVMIVFWLSAAHAHVVTGSAVRPVRGFFVEQRACRDAGEDALAQAERLCRRLRHRGVDQRSVKRGGCWGQLGPRRTVVVRFECE